MLIMKSPPLDLVSEDHPVALGEDRDAALAPTCFTMAVFLPSLG